MLKSKNIEEINLKIKEFNQTSRIGKKPILFAESSSFSIIQQKDHIILNLPSTDLEQFNTPEIIWLVDSALAFIQSPRFASKTLKWSSLGLGLLLLIILNIILGILNIANSDLISLIITMIVMHLGLSFLSKQMIFWADKIASAKNHEAGLNYLYEKMMTDRSFEIASKSYLVKWFLSIIMPNPTYFDRYEKMSVKN